MMVSNHDHSLQTIVAIFRILHRQRKERRGNSRRDRGGEVRPTCNMRGMKVSTSSICAASSISTLSYCKREERGAEEEEGEGEATSILTMCESVCGGRCSDLECKLHKVPSLERSVCAGHCNDLGFFY